MVRDGPRGRNGPESLADYHLNPQPKQDRRECGRRREKGQEEPET